MGTESAHTELVTSTQAEILVTLALCPGHMHLQAIVCGCGLGTRLIEDSHNVPVCVHSLRQSQASLLEIEALYYRLFSCMCKGGKKCMAHPVPTMLGLSTAKKFSSSDDP